MPGNKRGLIDHCSTEELSCARLRPWVHELGRIPDLKAAPKSGSFVLLLPKVEGPAPPGEAALPTLPSTCFHTAASGPTPSAAGDDTAGLPLPKPPPKPPLTAPPPKAGPPKANMGGADAISAGAPELSFGVPNKGVAGKAPVCPIAPPPLNVLASKTPLVGGWDLCELSGLAIFPLSKLLQ